MHKITSKDIISVLEEIIDISKKGNIEEAVLGEDIIMDSTDMLRVISRIESRFKVKLKMLDIINFDNIKDITDAVNRNLIKR
jgi:acyl carrier protein